MSSSAASIPVARHRRALARWLLLSGLVLLLLAPSFGGHAPTGLARVVQFSNGNIPPGGGSVVNLSVNLTDAPSFQPGSLTAPAGSVVALEVVNTGTFNHTFTLSNVANFVIPDSYSPAQLNAFFAANGTWANLALGPGSVSFFNVTIPSSDTGMSFEFVSLVAYQFQAGMRGFLNVTSAGGGGAVDLTAQTNDVLRFLPDILAVNATVFPVNVHVELTNVGGASHTFTLEAESNNTLLPGNFSAYFVSHHPLVDVSIVAQAVVWANFTVLAPGAYEYICKVLPHFANGMFGWLYVGIAPPAPAAAPSTAIVQAGVLIGAGSLLGIGIVFAVAGSYVGRFPRRPASPPH